MKFEKLSDKKFKVFKRSELINPILISGGITDTEKPLPAPAISQHDRIGTTAGSGADPYQETNNGQNFTQDQQTSADNTDIT